MAWFATAYQCLILTSSIQASIALATLLYTYFCIRIFMVLTFGKYDTNSLKFILPYCGILILIPWLSQNIPLLALLILNAITLTYLYFDTSILNTHHTGQLALSWRIKHLIDRQSAMKQCHHYFSMIKPMHEHPVLKYLYHLVPDFRALIVIPLDYDRTDFWKQKDNQNNNVFHCLSKLSSEKPKDYLSIKLFLDETFPQHKELFSQLCQATNDDHQKPLLPLKILTPNQHQSKSNKPIDNHSNKRYLEKTFPQHKKLFSKLSDIKDDKLQPSSDLTRTPSAQNKSLLVNSETSHEVVKPAQPTSIIKTENIINKANCLMHNQHDKNPHPSKEKDDIQYMIDMVNDTINFSESFFSSIECSSNPLKFAIDEDDNDLSEAYQLLKNDPDFINKVFYDDGKETTPLHYAIKHKKYHLIDYFIQRNANTNIWDGDSKYPHELLQDWENENLAEQLYSSPLHKAITNDKEEIAIRLIKKNQFLFNLNHNGLTPLQLAEKLNKNRLIQEIKEQLSEISKTTEEPHSIDYI
ncbi:MAG: hypothetical protein ACON5A_00555 [Candidatus Comchoanobacterales bacterium]